MNLALTYAHRHRAEQLIRATARDGADATATLLDHFPEDYWPALIAYLAKAACTARGGQPVLIWRSTSNQPDLLSEAERREAHRLHQKGIRTEYVICGEREYKRVEARRRRMRKAAS